MAVPLLTLTQKPVQYDVKQFGKDLPQLKLSGLLGTIVRWDANAKGDVLKANFVLIMKKVFALLDRMSIGTCFYGKGGFKGKIGECEIELGKCVHVLARNRIAREQIVEALGWQGACQAIPVVDLNPADFKERLTLGEQYFPRGKSIIQGRDLADRTFVSILLYSTTDLTNLFIATAHQRYRETDIDGDNWVLNFTQPVVGYEDTRSIAAFIDRVLHAEDARFIIKGFYEGVPLTTLTTKPVQHDVKQFGGDDTQLKQSGFLATIVKWDADTNSSVFKVNFVFIVKKVFAFLDKIRIGKCIYGNKGFTGKIGDLAFNLKNHPSFCASFLRQNRDARMQIVEVLGGEKACKAIPVVDLDPKDFKESLTLGDQYFSKGQGIIQGTDLAGRTFVSFRVEDSHFAFSNPHIVTVHQRYRETEEGGGDVWWMNSNRYDLGRLDIKEVADYIRCAKSFQIVPK